ncbi:MAG: hypothetical protein IH856_15070 [Deltaproteobacteria bacterium]|nr:hypothetical protein [Deltaproteobacteria bacterium]
MAKARTKSRQTLVGKKGEPTDLESVLDAVRVIWAATEQADSAEQDRLRRMIVGRIDRLRSQLNGKLRSHGPAEAEVQPTLFSDDHLEKRETDTPVPRFSEPQLRACGKDLASHALKFIPQASEFSDVQAYRDHLGSKLPFNSVATRRRRANYLVNRFFPGEKLHQDLAKFAGAAAGHPCLGDVLFYLAARSEQIIGLTAEEVVWPSLADGGVSRARINEFVRSKLTSEKGSKETTNAIARSYQHYGSGEASRTHLCISLRRGHLASFAYILHLEFPEPGMYTFEKLFDGPMHKWLLWERDWMIEQLYACRQVGLLTKVSEIDAMRQFTTKYPLAEAVDRIVPLLKGGEP